MADPDSEKTPQEQATENRKPSTLKAPRPRPTVSPEKATAAREQADLKNSILDSKAARDDYINVALPGQNAYISTQNGRRVVLKDVRDEDFGISRPEIDPVLTAELLRYDSAVNDAERQLAYYENESVASKALAGSVRSYLDTESDKTAEIRRQYKDFADRALLYEDLASAEDEAVAASTQRNVDYQKAFRQYGISPGMAAAPRYRENLSDILRPSLPDYVRPDYRLNQAVGLSGPEGFDDPDYDQYGMPKYAFGTDQPPPTRRIPFPLQRKPDPRQWPYRPRGAI